MTSPVHNHLPTQPSSPNTEVASRIAGNPNANLALRTIAKLASAGHVAYLAGGCIRDALLGLSPKDYDVATSAHPEQIRELFGRRRTLAIGAAFGVISVLDEKSSKQPAVEVATFRCDGKYSDGRHPDVVQFSTPERDAQRRDFTINGLFFDPEASRVLDFVGGVEDLKRRHLRAIGNPAARFEEDRLRLLRAVRFAATYQFSLEESTKNAIIDQADQVVVCSGERIGAEMQKMLRPSVASESIRLLRLTGLAAAIMPSIDQALQDSSSLAVLNRRLAASADGTWLSGLTLAILSTGNEANKTLARLAQSWHLSNDQRDAIRNAIENVPALLAADRVPWARLQPLLVHRYRDTAIKVVRAMILAESTQEKIAAIDRIEQALALPPEQLDPPPLITGSDLIENGLKPGPEFKSILQSVRDAQLNGLLHSKSQAQAWLDSSAG